MDFIKNFHLWCCIIIELKDNLQSKRKWYVIHQSRGFNIQNMQIKTWETIRRYHLFKKWTKRWADNYPQNIYKWIDKHIKRCLISLVIRKMKSRKLSAIPFMYLLRWLSNRSNKYIRSRELESCACWGMSNLQSLWKRVWWFPQ